MEFMSFVEKCLELYDEGLPIDRFFIFCQLPKAKVVEIEVINFTFTGHLQKLLDLEESIDKDV